MENLKASNKIQIRVHAVKNIIMSFLQRSFTCTVILLSICLILTGTAWATDSDGDNIPDDWETTYGLDPNNPNDADIDSDSDNYNNLCEYLHSTVPNDSNSIPTSNITITVPTNVNTIQRSINASIDYDEIVLSEGTYYEAINYNGKAITVISTDPNDPNVVSSTIINSNNNYIDVVTFNSYEDSNSVIQGVTITGGWYGINCGYNTSPAINKCIIRNNRSYGIYQNRYVSALITRCTIRNNRYYGIYVYGYGNVIISNCVIVNNSSAGIYVYDTHGTTRVINCTVYGNYNTGINGYIDEVTNCIVWNNNNDLSLYNGVLATYSCIEDIDSGVGNIHSDPMFINAGAGDYHLWYTSDCIDAGDPNSDYSREPDGGGGRVNMGAYGNTDGAIVIIDNDSDGVSDDWELANFLNPNDANDAILDMDGDGLRNIDEYNIAWDPNSYDIYDGIITNARTNYRYPSINLAMDMSFENDTLVLDPNTFYETININEKPLSFRSTDPNDPDVVSSTIINANNTSIPVVTYNLSQDGNYLLEGITLTGGWQGIYCTYTSVTPHINKCIIRNNSTYGIYLINSSSAIIRNCIINNNNSYGLYNYGYGSMIVENSIISNSHGDGILAYYANGTTRVVNCTVYGNYNTGINRYVDEVTNCIVWNNNDDLNLSNGVLATYSCIEDIDSGVGNIHSDPMFVNAGAGDYHLNANSICIDTGCPWSNYSNEQSPNGSRVNIGAYGNTDEAATTTDNDGDGIADSWEMYYWPGDDPNQHHPEDNTDGDIFTNLSEFLYGYNPTIQTSEDIQVFHMEVQPDQFDPTLGQTATIYYWVNADCNTVIDFNDTSSSAIVRSISESDTIGLNQLTWDGKDNDALIAKNLTYLIEIAIEGVGSSYFGENSVSINYSNSVSNIKINPRRIIPLNNEITTISFDLSIKDDAVVSVFDPDGALFWTANVDQSDPNEIIWYGLNTNEESYPSLEGEYKVEVRYDGMVEDEESIIYVYK